MAAERRSTLRRARRRLARWAAPELQAELDETERKLKAARRQLKRARAELADTAHAVPEPVEEVVRRVREEKLTYLKPPYLRALAADVLDVERAGLEGLIVEAGTALGGSAIVMAAAKAPERPMKVYDVFGMIPAPGDHDGDDVHERYATIAAGDARGVGGETYYGYRPDLEREVAASFARLGVPVEERNVELVKGLFEDTIVLDGPVAFAHLDGDWYESTMTCLERIAPRLVPGGRIVLDDYYTWSGCRRAVDEYFAAHDGFTLEHGAKLRVVRGEPRG
jgi:asparagine synthase (glutamine-hydrolysing)